MFFSAKCHICHCCSIGLLRNRAYWAIKISECHGLAEIQSDILTRCSTNINNAFIYNINSPISIRNCPILYDSHHPKVFFSPELSPICISIEQSRYDDLISLQLTREFWNVAWPFYILCYGRCTVQATLGLTHSHSLGEFPRQWDSLERFKYYNILSIFKMAAAAIMVSV